MDEKGRIKLGLTDNLVLTGVALSLAVWIGEAFLHAYVFQSKTFAEALVPDDLNEAWMRALIVSILIAFGAYAQAISYRRLRAERALAASEDRYRQIVETAQEGICVIDGQTNVRFANRKLSEMLGCRPEDVVGRPVASLIGEEESREILSGMESRGQGLMERHDARLAGRDGDAIWVLVSASALYGEIGEFTGSLLMFTDITERKKAEEDLKRSQELYSTLAESAQDCIFIVDGFMNIQYMNGYSARLLGRDPGDLAGMRLTEALPGLRLTSEQLRLTLFEGRVLTLESRINANNTEVWLETSLVPMIGRTAAVNSVMGLARDITERKRSEEMLREERDKAQRYLDIAGVILMILDPMGDIQLINKKGCEVLGYDEKEMVGRNWFDRFVPVETRSFEKQEFIRQFSGGGRTRSQESKALTKQGSERIISWHSVVLEGRGEARILSSGEDITELKGALDVAQRRVDELERFRKATVQREIRMKEIKDRILDLEKDLEKYTGKV